MRMERFIPFWGEELTSFTTPFEAGNGYIVSLDKVSLLIPYFLSFNRISFALERKFHWKSCPAETKETRYNETIGVLSNERYES